MRKYEIMFIVKSTNESDEIKSSSEAMKIQSKKKSVAIIMSWLLKLTIMQSANLIVKL